MRLMTQDTKRRTFAWLNCTAYAAAGAMGGLSLLNTIGLMIGKTPGNGSELIAMAVGAVVFFIASSKVFGEPWRR